MDGERSRFDALAGAPAAPRPRSVSIAAIIFVVLAALSLLNSLITVISIDRAVAALQEQYRLLLGFPFLSDWFSSVGRLSLLFGAVIGLLWSGALLVTAWGLLAGLGWARITGMVIGLLGVGGTLTALVGILASPPELRGGVQLTPLLSDLRGDAVTIAAAVLLAPAAVAYAVALWALVRNGRYFDRRQFVVRPAVDGGATGAGAA